jgi:hypothetical protein
MYSWSCIRDSVSGGVVNALLAISLYSEHSLFFWGVKQILSVSWMWGDYSRACKRGWEKLQLQSNCLPAYLHIDRCWFPNDKTKYIFQDIVRHDINSLVTDMNGIILEKVICAVYLDYYHLGLWIPGLLILFVHIVLDNFESRGSLQLWN